MRLVIRVKVRLCGSLYPVSFEHITSCDTTSKHYDKENVMFMRERILFNLKVDKLETEINFLPSTISAIFVEAV